MHRLKKAVFLLKKEYLFIYLLSYQNENDLLFWKVILQKKWNSKM